jgi:phosphoribosylformylglycinamidine (FGAM) synthase-like amidotransferase family enzyme
MYDFPDYIHNNKDYLDKFIKTKSKRKRSKFLAEADKEKLLAIVEICTNILKGRFELDKKQRRRLSKSAEFYRSIARSRSEKTARRRIQTGGSLTALAAVISPVLGVIAQHILDKTLGKTGNEAR